MPTCPLGGKSFPDPPAFRAAFVADWTEAMFVHYRVEPAVLRPFVPASLEIDLDHDRAFISLVAFTQRRLRPRIGGRWAAALSRPLAEHHFLNVRTYVRLGDEPGICFLAEWIPNRLACLLGPMLYGLPYRLGQLDYRRAAGRFDGCVRAGPNTLSFAAAVDVPLEPRAAEPGTLDAFLVERYTAFTVRGNRLYRFRISHAPWQLANARVQIHGATLPGDLAPPLAQPVVAHYSPGVRDVLITAPQAVAAHG